jgi:hypothetical protein
MNDGIDLFQPAVLVLTVGFLFIMLIGVVIVCNCRERHGVTPAEHDTQEGTNTMDTSTLK